MGMRHRQRLACETVRGRGGFHTAQQVIAYGLDDTTLPVIMMHRANLVGASQDRHFRSRQETRAVGLVSCRIAGRKVTAPHKTVTVIMVTDVDRTTACSLVGTFSLDCYTAEGIVQIISVLATGALVAVLRENQAVGIVIFVGDELRSRQNLLAA